ncbi:glycosyltransferase family 39 protein [Candidatus Gottesmanbacteria bacterium]|nr:glycosyltransferase family 39 protein [Candidatus Gottesmanbacteria bacterium]
MEKIKIWILIAAILLVSAFLRLYKISEYMTFLGDEGRDVLVVKRMIVDHDLTLLGPTASVGGFYLGPIYYYFMIPFLWLWNLDPTGPAVMVALFGVATTYLLYVVGRDFFGVRAGLAASALYMLSPLAISMGRSSWNPNIVPFFSLLLIYLLWRSVEKKRGSLLFWAGVVIGIGLQLHYLFLFLIAVAVIWYALTDRSKKNIRYYALGFAGLVVGFSPFLAFELLKGFPNTQTILRYLASGEDTGFSLLKFFGTINEVTFRLFGRLIFRLPQPEIWENIASLQKTLWLISVRTAVFVGFGALMVLRKNIAAKLLLVWYVVVVILFGFYKGPIYDYYFGIFFALPFLILGLLFDLLKKTKTGFVVGFGLLALLLWFNWQGQPFQFSPNRQLEQTRRIAQAVFEKAGGKPFNFALLADRNSDHAFRYFFEIWGNPPVTIEFPEVDPERKTITDQLLVLCESSLCQPLGHPLWEIAGFGRAEIEGSWDVPFVRIYKLVHYKEQ